MWRAGRELFILCPRILTTAKINKGSHRFWFSIFEINKFNESLVEMSMWSASPDSPDSWTWISNQPDQLLNFRQASDFPLGSRSTLSPQLLSQIFYLQVVIRLCSSSMFSFAKSAASSGSVQINFCNVGRSNSISRTNLPDTFPSKQSGSGSQSDLRSRSSNYLPCLNWNDLNRGQPVDLS